MGDRPLACHHSTDCAGSCTRKGIRMPYFSAHRQEHRIYMPEGNLYKSHHKYPGGEAAKFRCIICHLNTWGGGVSKGANPPQGFDGPLGHLQSFICTGNGQHPCTHGAKGGEKEKPRLGPRVTGPVLPFASAPNEL